MSKGTILIVEDERLIANDIARMLKKNAYSVIGIADNAESALDLIGEHKPDLCILDINIKGKIDGIELAAKLDIPFVYLTAYYDQSTVDRAKKTNPGAYIVKPFNERDLLVNIELAIHRPLPPKKEVSEKLFVRKNQELTSLMAFDILFVEAVGNQVKVYTKTETISISHTLKSIEAKLLPLGFMRIHRSYMINFDYVDSISDGFIFLRGQRVPFGGGEYKKEFMTRIAVL